MEKRKNAAGCASIVLLASLMIGCGGSGQDMPSSAENVPVSEEIMDQALNGTDEPNNHFNKDSEADFRKDDSADDTGNETEELIGNVKTIEEDSLIISQAFEEGEEVLVAPGDGSPDEVLISVGVSETTQYEVKTVKNGGVNGASDVETQPGTFSDLKEGVSIHISGYYEGETFQAEKICIMLFIG